MRRGKRIGLSELSGRGWLEYRVTLRSDDPPLHEVLKENVDGILTKSMPFGKVLNVPSSNAPVLWRYRAIISQGENPLAVLTEQTTSSDLFRSVLEDGYFRVDVVAPTNLPASSETKNPATK
jgi:hypothetical protein